MNPERPHASRLPASAPGKGLVAVAVIAFAGYAAVLLRDGLWTHSHRSPDGRLGPSELDGIHLARGILNVYFLVVTAAYVIWLLRSTEDSSTFRGLLKKALVFLALSLVAYPSTADVYGYLHFGGMGIRGVNPYLNPAASIPIPEMPLQSNWRQPSTYGPLAQLLFMIAVIGCMEGFKVSGSAQSVGEHTTSAVVQSIFVVILLDALAALFYMEMGW